MAGHSKWANIKHRKEKSDQKKGKEFSRAAKEIINAAKHGGADPKTNSKLRIAIQKARAVNMPNENIERNIRKASEANQADFHEIVYELYGHGGVGIMVEIMTDNKNRISSDMRIATNKFGGTLASPGSVAFNFEKKGLIQVEKSKAIEDELFALATDVGADDFDVTDECFLIITSVENFLSVKEALEKKEVIIKEASLVFIPKNLITCSKQDEEANLKLIDYIENLDDVDAVTYNMDL